MPPLFDDYQSDGNDEDEQEWTPEKRYEVETSVRKFGRIEGDARDFDIHFPNDLAHIPHLGVLISLPHCIVLLFSTSEGIYQASTFAGSSKSGKSNGFRTRATFNNPQGLCCDAKLNILVCDTSNGLIRLIEPNGYVSFLAGYEPTARIDGPRVVARFKSPTSIVTLPKDEFLITESDAPNILRKMTSQGHVTTLRLKCPELAEVNFHSISLSYTDPNELLLSTEAGIYRLDHKGNVLGAITNTAAKHHSKCVQLSDGRLVLTRSNMAPTLIDKDGNASNLLSTFKIHQHPTPCTYVGPCPDFPAHCDQPAPNGCISAFQQAYSSVVIIEEGKEDKILILDRDSHRQGVFEISTSKPIRRIAGSLPITRIGPLFFTPTDHVIECDYSCLRWMDEKAKFHPFAGSESESGFVDSTLLKARFEGASSLCFVPQDSVDTFPSPAPHMARPDPTKPSFWLRLVGAHSILVTDSTAHCIREIKSRSCVPDVSQVNDSTGGLDRAGEVTTFAGTGKPVHRDGPVTTAAFKRPFIIRRNSLNGDLVVAEDDNLRVRLIRGGVVSTIDCDQSLMLKSSATSYLLSPKKLSSLEIGPNSKIYAALGCVIFQIDVDESSASSHPTRETPGEKLVTKALTYVFAGACVGYHDDERKNSYFSARIHMAYNAVDDSLIVADFASHSVRRIYGEQVTTLGGTGQEACDDGASFQSAFTFPYNICCASDGRVLVVDNNCRFSILEYAHGKSIESCSHSMTALDWVPKPNVPTPRSDLSLKIGNSEWHLHKVIVQLRCPGLLKEDHVKQICEISPSRECFEALISSVYTDSIWRASHLLPVKPHSNYGYEATYDEEPSYNLTELYKWHRVASLAQSHRFVSSIESQIADIYRFKSHDPSTSLSILSTIVTLPDAETQLKIYLPFAATTFNRPTCAVTDAEAAVTLSSKPGLMGLLRNYISENRVYLPQPLFYDYHEDWIGQFRSLLHTSKPGQSAPAAAIACEYDFIIQGEGIWFYCHKLFLSRCPFFQALFESSFKDAIEASWTPTRDVSDSFYLNDEAMGALLDYIYTSDAGKIFGTPQGILIASALPFFYMESHARIQKLMGL
jgi:hypothetical protein